MPLYEFHCDDCKSKVEMQQSLAEYNAGKPILCVQCKKPMRRVIGAPSVRFVGDGWSHDNYGLKGGKGGGES